MKKLWIYSDCDTSWLYGELILQKWFSGHFHVNKIVRDDVQVLLDEVVTIE